MLRTVMSKLGMLIDPAKLELTVELAEDVSEADEDTDEPNVDAASEIELEVESTD
jgi:hypothetical protein